MTQQITAFTVADMKMLRPEINEALKALGEKYGIVLQAGNATGTVDGALVTFKLNLTIAGGKTKSDIRDDKAAKALALYQKLEFPDLKLDHHYKMGNDVFEITGFNTRGRTKPMFIKNIKTGAEYKCSIDQLRNAKAIPIKA